MTQTFKMGDVVRHLDNEHVDDKYKGTVGVVDGWLHEDVAWVVLFGPPPGCVRRCNTNIRNLELVSNE